MTLLQLDKNMFILRAKYLAPGTEEAVENGAVAISGSKIAAAGKYKDIVRRYPCEVIDMGEGIILPGLINAHTHLELTSLQGSIKPTDSFISWVIKLIRARRSWSEEELNASVQKGIKMSLESGTTTLADISTTGHALDNLQHCPLRKTVFHEVIDFNPSTAEATVKNARERITGFNGDNLLTVGVSPHAPYTVSGQLYRKCLALSQELNIPICTHIAETEEEIEFLTRGAGGFVNLLRTQNIHNYNCQPPGLMPVEYLNHIGALKGPWLLIHCNYLTDKEVSIIKDSGSSVVYCPRSHRFFGHENHPFRGLASEGVNVALGTDSLASNSSLSMLDEMRFLYELHPELAPQQILSMTTTNGAKALVIEGKVGRLQEGFEADIAVVEVKGGNGEIYERLLDPESKNILTTVAGEVCYDLYSTALSKSTG